MTIKEKLAKKETECEIKDNIIKELLDRLASGAPIYQPPIIIERHYPDPYRWNFGPHYISSRGISTGTSFQIESGDTQIPERAFLSSSN